MATLTQLHELEDHLDALIISYLSLFDSYQALQSDVSKHLSTGFISLAQANFSAPNRIRYGRDHYDQRMTGLRGVEITTANSKPTFTIIDLPSADTTNGETAAEDAKPPTGQSGLRNRKAKATTAAPTSTSTSTDASVNASDKPAEKDAQALEDEKEQEKEEDVVPHVNRKDPIRWFGILTPSSLKDAQREFVATLPHFAAVCSLLREIERQEEEVRRVRAEVRKMRDELGVVAELPGDDAE
ncbi:hypothetical protein TWF696_005399 [Orbilia brochopaga]|uniref:Vacuolar ATPase assembly protein VMA22 n=1 Tax=Orbilia brochopaga TaxID=3140254 RepID=A0AAV9V0T7_9PEZI